MTGGGIMLMSTDDPYGTLCTTDEVSAVIEEVQYAMGEGPCLDAHRTGRPVGEPDLASPATPRWIGFTGPVLDAGARAVFGFPLRIGGVGLGALNLYRDRPGPLDDEQHADVLVAADIAARAVLMLEAVPEDDGASDLVDAIDLHAVVHQASGMVAVQLRTDPGHALVRLRAHAFASGRTLDAVAHDVVLRVLRFDGPDMMDTDT